MSKCPVKKISVISTPGCDRKFGIMAVNWVRNNSMVDLASNFFGVKLSMELERCGQDKVRKNIPCLQVVQQYNKSMGIADLADMLLSLYKILCRTKC